MANGSNGQMRLQVADVSGQKQFLIHDIESDDTVGALLTRAVVEMNMPPNDREGRPLVYHARLDREGRHLRTAERIGDAVLPNDSVTIFPNIDAGNIRYAA